MATHEFEATPERPDATGTWTFLRVPFDVREAFGTRARVAVTGSVNGSAIRSSLLPQGDGTHILVVNNSVRARAKAEAGDTVRVALERDAAPRAVDVPPDLGSALIKGGANAAFEAMSNSNQKEYIDWIESAKRADTRVRRIERVAAMIADGRRLKSCPASSAPYSPSVRALGAASWSTIAVPCDRPARQSPHVPAPESAPVSA